MLLTKATKIVNFGGPVSGLRYQGTPTPEPGSEQAAVDAGHAGVGYAETLFTEGLVAVDLSWTPGLEMSGRVRVLGDGVDGYRVGDAVITLTIIRGGDYGQVTVAPAELVAPLPAGLDPVLAVVALANSMTMFVALKEIADSRRDKSVPVHIAAGGLGSQMGQVTRLLGAGRVIDVTRSEAKRQEILDLDYDEVQLAGDLTGANPTQFDAVANPVTGPARLHNLDLLRTGGRPLALGDISQEQDQQVSTTSLWLRGIDVAGLNLGASSQTNPGLVEGHLRCAVELMAYEEPRVRIADHLLIQEAAQAVATVRVGTTTGRIVLTHSQD